MVINTRSNRTKALLIFVLIWISRIPLAHADSGLLVMGGGAAEHDRLTIAGAIEKTLRGAGWSLSPKAPTKKEADGLLNCQDAKAPWKCVPSTISAKGVRHFFVVSVEMTQAKNGAPLVVITGRMIVTEPPEFAFVQRFCEHCADDRLIEASAELTRQLIQDLATRAGRTVVHFKSEPPSAEIILDGSKLGTTDATYSTYPGKHTAIIQMPGYVTEIREFTAEEGKTAELFFLLKPSTAAATTAVTTSTAPTTQTRPSRSYLLPGIAIGAGVTLALLGSVLLYHGLHESERYEYTRATAVGIPITLVGVGAIGAGLYVLWRSPDGSTPNGTAAPKAVVFGWSGSF